MVPEARQERTADELREASKHLRYEVMMFDETSRALAHGNFSGFTKYALLESFTIHTRALLHFFFADSGQPTDVLALDFFTAGSTWLSGKPSASVPVALSRVNRRVGKEIAHLTYNRLEVKPDEWKWDITAMRAAMLPVIDQFARLVPGDHLDPRAWKEPLLADISPNVVTSTTTGPTVLHTSVNTPTVNRAVATTTSDHKVIRVTKDE